jgi:NhaP-type Na+/H+ or K+/H+ antiporter
LQGESLLNDATALLIYRAAVAAAVGSFSLVGGAPILSLAATSVRRSAVVSSLEFNFTSSAMAASKRSFVLITMNFTNLS